MENLQSLLHFLEKIRLSRTERRRTAVCILSCLYGNIRGAPFFFSVLRTLTAEHTAQSA